MKLKEKIMIERLSKLSELQPAQQEEVLRDPDLQAALLENRLLFERAADAPPAPLLKPTLEQALSRPKPREVSTMSVRTLFAGKKWYAQAAIAGALIAVIAVTAMVWKNSQAGFEMPEIQATHGGTTRIAQSMATEVETGVFSARCNLAGVKGESADGKQVSLTLAFNLTSSLSAQDAAQYARDLEKYDRDYAEYERKLDDFNNGRASAPVGMVLAKGVDYAGRGGGPVVAKQPTPPFKPAVPVTVLARAMNDEAAAVSAAVVELMAKTAAGGIDTPGFCSEVQTALSPMFEPGLGSIDSVEVGYISIR